MQLLVGKSKQWFLFAVLRKAFEAFDSQKSGSIPCDMVADILRLMGQPFDKKILEELIEEVDADSKYISIFFCRLEFGKSIHCTNVRKKIALWWIILLHNTKVHTYQALWITISNMYMDAWLGFYIFLMYLNLLFCLLFTSRIWKVGIWRICNVGCQIYCWRRWWSNAKRIKGSF